MEVDGATAPKLPKQRPAVNYAERFDQIAENIFQRCNQSLAGEGAVYEVPQYPIEEHQNRRQLESQLSHQCVFCTTTVESGIEPVRILYSRGGVRC